MKGATLGLTLALGLALVAVVAQGCSFINFKCAAQQSPCQEAGGKCQVSNAGGRANCVCTGYGRRTPRQNSYSPYGMGGPMGMGGPPMGAASAMAPMAPMAPMGMPMAPMGYGMRRPYYPRRRFYRGYRGYGGYGGMPYGMDPPDMGDYYRAPNGRMIMSPNHDMHPMSEASMERNMKHMRYMRQMMSGMEGNRIVT